MRLSHHTKTCDFKVVLLSSSPTVRSALLDALIGLAGPGDVEVVDLAPTDDGEQNRMVRLTRRFQISNAPAGYAPCLYFFEAPTNAQYGDTRAQVLKGADAIVVVADGTQPPEHSARWTEEMTAYHTLANMYFGPTEPSRRVLVQYVCPPSATTSVSSMRQAINPRGEFAEQVVEGSDVGPAGSPMLELIIERLTESS